MAYSFQVSGTDDFILTNDDYDKVVVLYGIENDSYAKIHRVLCKKYRLGQLQRDVSDLKVY